MNSVGVIGLGAVGRYVAARLETATETTLSAVIVRAGREKDLRSGFGDNVEVVSCVSELSQAPDIIVDCAGHDGLRQHGTITLAQGIDLVTVSIGALADQVLYNSLVEAAVHAKSTLHLASGAIGALDALSAAQVGGLDRVVYRGRKPPAGWMGTDAQVLLDLEGLTEPATHFQGSARSAALKYPKNANVAAAVALAGMGFDQTEVELIADPGVSQNIHEIEAEGAFGSLNFRIKGHALPDNPKSSALTAMSAVRKVLNLSAALVQ